jgi:CRP-like cAMP-binding protein/uncharacterized protein (DUF2249 family)
MERGACGRLDVRPLTSAQRYERVSAVFAQLGENGLLRIVVDHEPRALRMWLSEVHGGQYVWTQRNLGDNYWEATIEKTVPLGAAATPNEVALHSSWLCNAIETGARKRLAAGAVLRRIAAGMTIAEQGTQWPYIGLVIRGSVMATVSTDAGRDYTLYQTSPFDVFGELQALDTGVTIARFEAGTPAAEILMLPRDLVLELADKDGQFAHRLATICAQRGRLVHELLYARIAKPTITRLAAAMLPYAIRSDGFEAALPPLPGMTQSQLAHAAGTVKDVIGRDLATLHAAGAIKLRSGRVAQINEARLRTFL